MTVQMTRQQAVRPRARTVYLVWGASALYLVIASATLGLQAANDPATLWVNTINVLVRGTFVTVGTLIAWRRPENLIGWLFLLQGLLSEIGWFGIEYSVYGLITAPGSLPKAEWMGMFGIGLRDISFNLSIAPIMLIFPDGRLLSSRWRSVLWLFLVNSAFSVADVLLEPQGYEFRLRAVPSLIGDQVAPGVIDLVRVAWLLTLVLTVAASVASVVLRFRRARGDERQQLKWFAYAAFLALAFALVFAIGFTLFPPSRFSLPGNVGSLIFSFAIVGFPISAGIAILKYRLYDIEIIIRRTLIYGVLSASLAFVYFGSVVLLQQLIRAVTGQTSELAIIVSTLAIAALFVPLRRRVQSVIDRRFYRRKYDAQKVLAQFAATARDEVDLNKLTERLLEVVDETMQPTNVSLWLKGPEREVK